MWHVKFNKKKIGAVSNLRLDRGEEYMIAAGFTKTGIILVDK